VVRFRLAGPEAPEAVDKPGQGLPD